MSTTLRLSPAAGKFAALVVLPIGVALMAPAVSGGAAQGDGMFVVQGPPPGSTSGTPRDGGPAPVAPAGTATISGTVVSSDGRRPVRRATVHLATAIPAPPLRTMTDDEGRFVFEDVASGRVTLSVSKPGYLESRFGQSRPGSGGPGTEVSVSDGQRIEGLVVPLARGGVLAGTVTDDRGEPAFGTDVRAFRHVWESGERTLRLAGSDRADDRGGYRIGALPPGEYVVMATPPLDPSQMFAGAAMSMPPLAATAVGMAWAPPPTSFGVDASGSEFSEGYAPVYYPASRSSAGAVVVTLETGEERAGLDVAMPFTPLGRITGLVTGPPDSPGATEVRLIDLEDALGAPVRSTIAGADGAFVFSGVPPGRYRVEASAGPQQRVVVDQAGGRTRMMMTMSASPSLAQEGLGRGGLFGGDDEFPDDHRRLWATAEVLVADRNTPAVLLQLEEGRTVSGRVAFDGSAPAPDDPSGMRIVLNAASARDAGVGSAIGQVANDGTFTIPGVIPGRYRVSVLGPAPWRAKSLDVAGQDALDVMLDVAPRQDVTGAALTLTTRLATLSGTLREATGQPAPAYTVVLFADDKTYWTPQSRRIRATRPGTDGRFAIADLPAGRYRLAAFDDVEEGRWFDPALLEEVAPVSISVVLIDGQATTQDVQVAR